MTKHPILGRVMRYLAGAVYALLAVYQMLTTHYIVQFADPAKLYVAWNLAVASIALFAALAVWMFAGGRALGGGARRGIAVGTVLYLAYQLLTHEAQATLIQTALYQLLPGLYEQTLYHYIFLLGRLLLVVLAAFFALCSRRPAGDAEEAGEDAGGAAGEKRPAQVVYTAAARAEQAETLVLFSEEDEAAEAEAVTEAEAEADGAAPEDEAAGAEGGADEDAATDRADGADKAGETDETDEEAGPYDKDD